jgi:hypothetical protein
MRLSTLPKNHLVLFFSFQALLAAQLAGGQSFSSLLSWQSGWASQSHDARPVGTLPLVVACAAAAQRRVTVTAVVVVVMPVKRQALARRVAAQSFWSSPVFRSCLPSQLVRNK